jgi:hypothetical protein
MARGYSKASSESSFNEDPDRREVKDLMDSLLGTDKVPKAYSSIDESAWDQIESDVLRETGTSKAWYQRDDFDEALDRAKEVLDNPSELSVNLEEMAKFVPLSADEAKAGKRPYDVIVDAWNSTKNEDGEFDMAQRRDRGFRYNDGSYEERFSLKWVKGFIKDRVEDATKERKKYDVELNNVRQEKIVDAVADWLTELDQAQQDRDRERRESYPRGDREEN